MASKTKTRELKWPALGVVRRACAESPPQFKEPFPTPWAVNCRPDGASRPGLVRYDGPVGLEVKAPDVPEALLDLLRGSGIPDVRSWCCVDDEPSLDGGFVFFSHLGLFLISRSGNSLRCISDDRFPEELGTLGDPPGVRLVHSQSEHGVYVFILTEEEQRATHWFFDLAHCGFWPITLKWDHQPVNAVCLDGKVVLACRDRVLREVGGTDDDGMVIKSYALVGPLRLGGPDTAGILTAIRGQTALGNVPWRIVTGDTPDEACENGRAAIAAYQSGDTATAESYAKASGAFREYQPMIRYPRVRAKWACVLLRSSEPWEYGSITIDSRILER